MIFLDIIIGIVLISWGVWEYRDKNKYFRSKSVKGSVTHFIKTNGILLAITLVLTGLLFIFRILRVEYFL